MAALITPQIVKQRVDQIRALPSEERPAIATLNQWLIEGLEQNRVENSGACAMVALSVTEDKGGSVTDAACNVLGRVGQQRLDKEGSDFWLENIQCGMSIGSADFWYCSCWLCSVDSWGKNWWRRSDRRSR